MADSPTSSDSSPASVSSSSQGSSPWGRPSYGSIAGIPTLMPATAYVSQGRGHASGHGAGPGAARPKHAAAQHGGGAGGTIHVEKKRKTSRACLACQTSHMHCDAGRPCERCIKRGLASTCRDGLRKAPGAESLGASPPGRHSSHLGGGGGSGNGLHQHANESLPMARMFSLPAIALPGVGLDGSSAPPTMISPHMPHQRVGAPYDPDFRGGRTPMMVPMSVAPPSSLMSMVARPILGASGPNGGGGNGPMQAVRHPGQDPMWARTVSNGPPTPSDDPLAARYAASPSASGGAGAGKGLPSPSAPATTLRYDPAGAAVLLGNTSLPARMPMSPDGTFVSAALNRELTGMTDIMTASLPASSEKLSEASDAGAGASAEVVASIGAPSVMPTDPSFDVGFDYDTVTEPFSYANGYHRLLMMAQKRMSKEDVLRICKAWTSFRPNFLSITKNLSTADLIFAEKCFRRTAVEFRKLLAFIGTPTCVWRRTGEIAVVGKEFTLLTDWSAEEISQRNITIYELMDTRSVVEFWEQFAYIAMDNSAQSVLSKCNILRTDGTPIPCTVCYTLKRDIFDVPLCVVGSFLPIFNPSHRV